MDKAICILTDWSSLDTSEYLFLRSLYVQDKLKIFKVYNIVIEGDLISIYSDNTWQARLYKKTFNKAFKII